MARAGTSRFTVWKPDSAPTRHPVSCRGRRGRTYGGPPLASPRTEAPPGTVAGGGARREHPPGGKPPEVQWRAWGSVRERPAVQVAGSVEDPYGPVPYHGRS